MNKTLIAAALIASASAFAQEPADVKSFEEVRSSLPPERWAPTTENTRLPGPSVLPEGECSRYPEVCKARKEELRRKRQACRDDASHCDDPALKSAKND